VRYYLRKGQTEKARAIADFAGEVYSYSGLIAKGVFLECNSNYDGALEWFGKIEERSDTPFPLVAYCVRYKSATGDARFDGEVRKRIKVLFPHGMEKAVLGDLRGPPADGVVVAGTNDLLLSSGLKKGEVIVALNGVRTHTLLQYMYVRDLKDIPELDLLVWQEDAYHEIKASPPHRRFGVMFDDYKPPKPAQP
jgi:hypothetical protein